MVEQYREFARHLGADAEPEHVLPADPASERWAAELCDELAGEPVLLNVGASKPANRWAPERMGMLAEAIQAELGLAVCLTGGPGDRPATDRALAEVGQRASLRDLVGQTSLLQLIALARRARVFVGCDTGPMHIAAACGTPVVALFGAADPERTGPWGAAHRVVRVPPSCAPCNRRSCNQPRHWCMDDIHVDHVLDAVRERIQA